MIDVVQGIRLRGSVPIIVLSTRDVERDVVAALTLGADDYMTKPVHMDELVARIRVALRHTAARDHAPGDPCERVMYRLMTAGPRFGPPGGATCTAESD